MNKYKIVKLFKLNIKESCLLYPEGIIKLNNTARDILKECNNNTLNEIKSNLLKKYENVDGVDDFLKDAIKNNWINKNN